MGKESMDFGTASIPKLFRSLFWPTLIGMISSACTAIVDGIFVGRALGADALAAVNIGSPLMTFATGVGMLFGAGASVIAAIQLSRNKIKTANSYITQAFLVSSVLIIALTILASVFGEETARLFGSSAELTPLVKSYILGFLPFLALYMLQDIGLFVIRLDGSPRFVLYCTVIPALLNIILDYVFIYHTDMGLFGAGFASGIAGLIGGGMVLIYMFRYTRNLNFAPIRLSLKSLRKTFRNARNMVKIGFPSFLAEISSSFLIITGNYIFIRELGADGVAAFSVACYIFIVVALVSLAVSQSAQPIISFNYGSGNMMRANKAFRLSNLYSLVFGLLLTLGVILFAPLLISLFLAPGTEAYEIAVRGIPYFAPGFLFFALNMVWIGYFQSVERTKPARVFTLLRGLAIMIASFMILPKLIGIIGIWLAVPTAETLTFLLIVIYYQIKKNRQQIR